MLDLTRAETASIYLKTLCEIGILREAKVGREKLFIHPKFMGLMTSDTHQFSRYTGPGKPSRLRNARVIAGKKRVR